MTDQSAQEPTMEEILASIRRIISEDDAPAAEAAPEVAPEPFAAQEPAPEPAPIAEVSPAAAEAPAAPESAPVEEDVLDLTEIYQAPAAETIGDLDVSTPEAEPEPEPYTSAYAEPAPAAVPAASYDALVGESASASAASAFAGLAASFARPEPVAETSGTGPTVDELARALLRPMLKDWLDANLPGIVETAVRKEVERIARSAG